MNSFSQDSLCRTRVGPQDLSILSQMLLPLSYPPIHMLTLMDFFSRQALGQLEQTLLNSEALFTNLQSTIELSLPLLQQIQTVLTQPDVQAIIGKLLTV